MELFRPSVGFFVWGPFGWSVAGKVVPFVGFWPDGERERERETLIASGFLGPRQFGRKGGFWLASDDRLGLRTGSEFGTCPGFSTECCCVEMVFGCGVGEGAVAAANGLEV